MQLNFLEPDQVAETIEQSRVLSTLQGLGMTTIYVVEFGRQDMLLVVDGVTGKAAAIYPCSSFDHETGSVHDNAREVLAVC